MIYNCWLLLHIHSFKALKPLIRLDDRASLYIIDDVWFAIRESETQAGWKEAKPVSLWDIVGCYCPNLGHNVPLGLTRVNLTLLGTHLSKLERVLVSLSMLIFVTIKFLYKLF